MQVTIDVPDYIEKSFRESGDDIARTTREALAIEAYRTGKISLGDFAEMLGMGSIEALDWLGRRGIPMNYSLEDLYKDRETLKDFFARHPIAKIGSKK